MKVQSNEAIEKAIRDWSVKRRTYHRVNAKKQRGKEDRCSRCGSKRDNEKWNTCDRCRKQVKLQKINQKI